MKILKQLILSALLLVTAGGRAQEAAHTFDEVSGRLTITSSGTIDLNSFNQPVTVVEIALPSNPAEGEGVTILNINGTYTGKGGGTMLNPQGGALTTSTNYRQNETYVLMTEQADCNYTISSSGLGTLCFPNTVNLDEYPNVRAFKATGITELDEESMLTLTSAIIEDEEAGTRSIPAYTPVIIYQPGGGDVELGSTGLVSQAPVTIQQEGNLLMGINNTMTVPVEAGHNHYLMQSHDEGIGFYPALDATGQPRSFKATQYRCFLNLNDGPGSAQSLSLIIPTQTPTGIDTSAKKDCQPDGFYDLNGRRVTHPISGRIYIMRLDGHTTKTMIQ